ncbi:hypothetical protein FOA52_011886 [Chlamydomonas sp. UWO 241]|nr:hypothetical protein FOA52_011886 [Chlamydomonas sp. UWO 241]
MVLCGAQPVFYTYPAWNFGTKRREDGGPAENGPGPAGTGARSTLGSTGHVYGPPRSSARTDPAPYGDGYLTTHNKAQGPRAPAYTFGGRTQKTPDATPGPYGTRTDWGARSTSWGAPPRTPRPASAPPPIIHEAPAAKGKGQTFGAAHRSRQEVTPGPLDYQCACGHGCCKACDSYSGVLLKGRRPQMYGVVMTKTPGPAAYHTDCSTIGVATARCESGGTQGASSRRVHRH